MNRRILHSTCCLLTLICAAGLAEAGGRAIQPEDFLRFATVAGPQVSPDGKWVAYTLTTVDRDKDEARTGVWLVSWDGKQQMQLARDLKDADSPRFSPDGRFVAFLATPAGGQHTQVMLLDRNGGEPRALTSVNDSINSIAWSPDGKRLLLVQHGGMADEEGAKDATPRPIVIDAMHFKQDITGYIPADAWKRLFLLDVESGKLEPLTSLRDGIADYPAFSPDGSRIAYVRTRHFGPDEDGREDVVLIDAAAGSSPQVLARVYSPNAQHLSWSPDGKDLAYMEGLEPRLGAYVSDRLFVRPVAGGEAHLVAQELGPDRFDMVMPSISILAEPPVSIVDKVVDRRGTRAVAQAYLQYLYSPPAQEIAARHFFRPRDPEVAARYAGTFAQVPLVTVDGLFGGWAKAQAVHFADGGTFDRMYGK